MLQSLLLALVLVLRLCASLESNVVLLEVSFSTSAGWSTSRLTRDIRLAVHNATGITPSSVSLLDPSTANQAVTVLKLSLPSATPSSSTGIVANHVAALNSSVQYFTSLSGQPAVLADVAFPSTSEWETSLPPVEAQCTLAIGAVSCSIPYTVPAPANTTATASSIGVAVVALSKVVLHFDGLNVTIPQTQAQYNSMPCTTVSSWSGAAPNSDGCTSLVTCEVIPAVTPSGWTKPGTIVSVSVGVAAPLTQEMISTVALPCRVASGSAINIAAKLHFVSVLSSRAAPLLYNASYDSPPTVSVEREESIFLALISLASISGFFLLLMLWLYTREDFLTEYWDSTNVFSDACDCDPPLALKAVPAFLFAITGLTAAVLTFAYFTVGSTLEASHWVLMEEYHSPRCRATALTWRPHRLSGFRADGECHRVEAQGAFEGPMWAKGTCGANGSTTSITTALTQELCRTSQTVVHLASDTCLREDNLFPEFIGTNRPDKTQFLVLSCVEEVLATSTIALFPTATIAPERTVAVQKLPLQQSLEGRTGGVIPFEYHGGPYVVTVDDVHATQVDDLSVSLVAGNLVASGAPSALPLNTVSFVDPSNHSVSDAPRDPPNGPFEGVVFNRYGQAPPLLDANVTASRVTTAMEGFVDAFRYQGLDMTLFNVGSVVAAEGNDDAAFSATFWLKADNNTVGFPFIIADNWKAAESRSRRAAGSSPLATRLASIVFGGAPYSSFFDTEDAKVYFAVSVEGPQQTIRVVTASGAAETPDTRVAEVVWTTAAVPSLSRVFNGQWHFIALTSQVQNERRTFRLYVDCETSFVDQGWEQCYPESATLESIPAAATLAGTVASVFNASTETFTAGAAIWAGYFNGGLFNVRFHQGALEQERIIGFGARSMRQYATISTMGSFALGTALGSIFIVFFALSIYQFFGESAKADLGEDDRADVKDEAQGQAQEAGALASKAMGTAKAGSGMAGRMTNITASTRESLAKLKAMLALFLGVVQSMALYFQGWRWPFQFEIWMGWMVMPFTFNLNLPSIGIDVPPLAGPLLQIGAVLLAFLTLWFLVIADQETFEGGMGSLASRMVDEKDDEETLDKPVCHEHEYHVIAPPGRLGGKLILWGQKDKRKYLTHSVFEGEINDAWNKMSNENLTMTYLVPDQLHGRNYRAVKEPDDSDDDTDTEEDDDDEEDGSDEDWGISSRSKKKPSCDKVKEDTPVWDGKIFVSRRGASDPTCSLMFEVINGPQEGTTFPIETKRESDNASCPKHSMDLSKAPSSEGLVCSTTKVPWSGERCDADASSDWFVCRKKNCTFAICGKCSRMTKTEKTEAAGRAVSRSIEAENAPKYDFEFNTAPKDTRLSPVGLTMKPKAGDEQNDNDSESDDGGGASRKRRGRRGKHDRDDGIIDKLNSAVSKLFPQKGQVVEHDVCKVITVDPVHRKHPTSPEGHGTLVLYALGGNEGKIEYSLHYRADSSAGTVVDVIPNNISVKHNCPSCNVHLVPGRPEVQLTLAEHLDDNGNSKFQCTHFLNLWGGTHCNGIQEDEPFYVCPEEGCIFGICGDCAELTPFAKAWAAAIGQLKALGIGGVIGFFTLMAASALYFPTVQTSILIVVCHQSFRCQFPGCYDNPTPQFITTIVGAGGTLLIVGVGFIVFLGHTAFTRKRYLISDINVINNEEYLNDEKEAPESFFGILLCDITPDAWGRILDQDQSVLRPLYDQFEFKHMCILPIFNLFKVMLVMPIVFLPPNSLRQLIGAASVECAQLFFLCATNAYVNPWIDTLSKTGSLHQLFQLSLMSFHRVLIADNPEAEGLSLFMSVGSGLYAAFLVGVMVHVAIIPAIRAALEKRARRNAFRKQREEQIAEKKRAVMEAQQNRAAEPNGPISTTRQNTTQPMAASSTKRRRASDDIEHSLLELEEFGVSVSSGDTDVDEPLLSKHDRASNSSQGRVRANSLAAVPPPPRSRRASSPSAPKQNPFKGVAPPRPMPTVDLSKELDDLL